ncbi:MAG TPA: ATP-binding protein [bacterium]|nr:ATP-binding protein [bacterium]
MNREGILAGWMRRRTVARDLIFGVSVVTSIVVLTMGALNYVAVVNLAEEELRDRLVRTVNILSRRLGPLMIDDRFDEAIDFMREAKKDLPDSVLKLQDEHDDYIFIAESTQNRGDSETIVVEKTIVHERMMVGRIFLGLKTDRVTMVKRNMLNMTVSLMFVLILALLLTIRVIVRRILLGSLERMQQGIRIIANGNYDHRIADSPYTDVEIIIKEINSMAHFISNRTLQLQREIGERKRTEIALTESRRKLMTLMQNLPGMAYRCANDPQYTMYFVSQGVEALTGYSAEQIIDNRDITYDQIIHPDDRKMVHDIVQAGLQDNGSFEMEYRIVTADECVKWVWEAGLGVMNVFNEVQALEGFIMDITSRRLAEEELKRLNEELEMRVEARTADLEVSNRALKESLKLIKETQSRLVESEKLAALGGMVAGMAHEINNPLGISVTAASYLDTALKKISESGRGDEAGGEMDIYRIAETTLDNLRESSRMIMTNLRRASELVNGFKRVASDQSHEERRAFNLRDYLDEILLSLRPELKKTSIEVKIRCPENLVIESYPGAISQIITNLILNALRHAYEEHSKGFIRIHVRQAYRHLLIVFSDDGTGIPEDILPKIFDPFFTTKRGKGGSGLGLHIIFNLVTNTLKGEIHCESQPGEGTRFVIRIPYSQLGNSATMNK